MAGPHSARHLPPRPRGTQKPGGKCGTPPLHAIPPRLPCPRFATAWWVPSRCRPSPTHPSLLLSSSGNDAGWRCTRCRRLGTNAVLQNPHHPTRASTVLYCTAEDGGGDANFVVFPETHKGCRFFLCLNNGFHLHESVVEKQR